MQTQMRYAKQGNLVRGLANMLSRTREAARGASVGFTEIIRRSVSTHHNATGRTAKSMRPFVEGAYLGPSSGSLEVGAYGRFNLYFLQHGRGPGKMPPEPPIRTWFKAKGGPIWNMKASKANRQNLGSEGLADQAFINMAFALQRLFALRRTRTGMAMKTAVARVGRRPVRRMTYQQHVSVARAMSRSTIKTNRLPPLRRVVEWMYERGIRPTLAMAFKAMVYSIRVGIGKRGTRRFRRETPNYVGEAITRGREKAVEYFFWRMTMTSHGQGAGP